LSGICITGIGAVSPAGWAVGALRHALESPVEIPVGNVARPGLDRLMPARKTPAATPRPAFLSHARLRRTSTIAQFAVAAALEALGIAPNSTFEFRISNFENARLNSERLGIVFCSMTGCVAYSKRFYDEVLKDPSTASPLVFPETVYNSPSSHLAALLGTSEINYTLVGDPGTFLQGLALAAGWLESRRVDSCLVVGAEELDWLTAEAMLLFEPEVVVSDGAGAVCLRRADDDAAREDPAHGSRSVRLDVISESHLFHDPAQRMAAALATRRELRSTGEDRHLLCDGQQGTRRFDAAERDAWQDWPGARCSVKRALGEAFVAAAAWQCVAAVDALRRGRYPAATVSVVGCNEQAIAARFTT
jgi:3-oxoacyl-(acyl-carrier-protein) synthase